MGKKNIRISSRACAHWWRQNKKSSLDVQMTLTFFIRSGAGVFSCIEASVGASSPHRSHVLKQASNISNILPYAHARSRFFRAKGKKTRRGLRPAILVITESTRGSWYIRCCKITIWITCTYYIRVRGILLVCTYCLYSSSASRLSS